MKSVTVWGSGTPRREFLHVDDLADACVYLMQKYSGPEIVNVGWGQDVSILELAELVKGEVGYEGDIEFDTSKPEGTPRKLPDNSRLHLLAGSRLSISKRKFAARTTATRLTLSNSLLSGLAFRARHRTKCAVGQSSQVSPLLYFLRNSL